jgi:hypothetical protein
MLPIYIFSVNMKHLFRDMISIYQVQTYDIKGFERGDLIVRPKL